MKDDLFKLNLVLNSFSVSPIYVSWLFEVVSVTVALYTTHLVRYLLKNIPVHGKDLYIKTLIRKSETFVKNIRWRAFFYLNSDLRMEKGT